MEYLQLLENFRLDKDLGAKTKSDLVTPALLLDLDAFDFNINKMSAHALDVNLNLRPHGKTHKCPEIARRQIEAGALGLSVATIREAEAMTYAGISGLLITSELVGKPKIERLIKLAIQAPDIMSVTDNIAHANILNEAAMASKVTLNVLIDIDPAGRRTGVAAGKDAIALAEEIVALPNLRLCGVHGYSGKSAHITGYDNRRQHSINAMTPIIEVYSQLKKMGLPVEIMSGGSTGTYNIDNELKDMTELQAGSYVFMDVEYKAIGGKSSEVYEDFKPSLSVMATVISKNHSDIATTDAGIKAFATDSVDFLPEAKGIAGVSMSYGGDEHGILKIDYPGCEINIEDRIEFIVPHCDPTVNLYDRIYCTRGDNIVDIWPIVGKYGN